MNINLEAQQLEKISFISGTTTELNFEIEDEFGNQVPLSNAMSLKWALCPYGQPEYSVLEKTGTPITGTNIFYVTLNRNDTYPLGGMYIQQAEFTDATDGHTAVFQGIVNIIKAIQTV